MINYYTDSPEIEQYLKAEFPKSNVVYMSTVQLNLLSLDTKDKECTCLVSYKRDTPDVCTYKIEIGD